MSGPFSDPYTGYGGGSGGGGSVKIHRGPFGGGSSSRSGGGGYGVKEVSCANGIVSMAVERRWLRGLYGGDVGLLLTDIDYASLLFSGGGGGDDDVVDNIVNAAAVSGGDQSNKSSSDMDVSSSEHDDKDDDDDDAMDISDDDGDAPRNISLLQPMSTTGFETEINKNLKSGPPPSRSLPSGSAAGGGGGGVNGGRNRNTSSIGGDGCGVVVDTRELILRTVELIKSAASHPDSMNRKYTPISWPPLSPSSTENADFLTFPPIGAADDAPPPLPPAEVAALSKSARKKYRQQQLQQRRQDLPAILTFYSRPGNSLKLAVVLRTIERLPREVLLSAFEESLASLKGTPAAAEILVAIAQRAVTLAITAAQNLNLNGAQLSLSVSKKKSKEAAPSSVRNNNKAAAVAVLGKDPGVSWALGGAAGALVVASPPAAPSVWLQALRLTSLVSVVSTWELLGAAVRVHPLNEWLKREGERVARQALSETGISID